MLPEPVVQHSLRCLLPERQVYVVQPWKYYKAKSCDIDLDCLPYETLL